jgi:predicted enzyme related to lactoylglutathione lyase
MGFGIGMVTIDCADPQRLAGFWSEALRVSIQGDYGDFVFLERPPDGGPAIGLHRVPEPRSGKNRVHVDLSGGSRAAEVPRLVGLGSTVVAEHEMPGLVWTVLTDPEGNEFCVGEHTE